MKASTRNDANRSARLLELKFDSKWLDGSEIRPGRSRDSKIMWEVMFWPIVACVLLPWLLVYLGLHVVQRGIIFIDIAMAQMASLGICLAVLVGLEPESWIAFVIALASRWSAPPSFPSPAKRASQVPQEAIIGISLRRRGRGGDFAAQPLGARQRRDSQHAGRRYHGRVAPTRSGAASPFSWPSASCISFCAEIFLLVSFRSRRAYAGRSARALVGFSFLCAFRIGRDDFRPRRRRVARFQLPHRAGRLCDHPGAPIRRALLIGWIISLVGGIGGLVLLFCGDLPSGAAIVCTFGGAR